LSRGQHTEAEIATQVVPHGCDPLGQLREHALPVQVSPDGQSALEQQPLLATHVFEAVQSL